jgi:uncharacterized protein
MSDGLPARLSVVTLGARDLGRLSEFYVALGWPQIVALDDFAAFQTRGAVLTLYELDKLLTESGFAEDSGRGGFTLAINVDEREQVDEAIAAARAAGAHIAMEPVDWEWGGRSAHFTDPEDNHWEVAWVPPDSEIGKAVRRAVGKG